MDNKLTSDLQLLYNFITLAYPVSDDLFNEIIKYYKKKSYKKDEPILRAGEIETRSNIVVKGVVHQYVYDEDTPVTINITPKGLSFNSLKSYIEGSPSIEIHEAITDVELIYFEKEDLELLAKKSHEFSLLLFKIYEQILVDRENRMFLLQHKSPEKRFNLFREIVERSNWILKGTPDKYIASYLNMTPQQYSKEKRKFKKRLNNLKNWPNLS